MRERLRPSDYRFLAICLTLLAVTTWFSVRNFHRAFPEASIDFRVNRDQAHSLAERFLSARGFRAADYRHASRFHFDDNAKTFLEREAGLEEANRIMGARVRLWRWSNRWFRPQQKEEFLVDVTPKGEVVGFEHEIAETDARPSVPPEQARSAAEDFLRTAMRRDPATLEFVEGSTVARPARTDHVFTWKERDFSFKDAENRIEVTVLGSEIGAYREYLKVPEQWRRDYARLRSGNQVAQSVDGAFSVLLVIGLLAWLVVCIRRRQVKWRRAAMVGVIGGALMMVSQLNEFPLDEFYFPNTDSYSSFVIRQLLNAVLAGFGSAGFLFVLTAAAEPLYREAFGDKVSLGNLFAWRGIRTRSFLLGSVLGVALTGIFVAYQIAFYMAASRMGAWSPADVPYSNLLNTKFPWAYVLFGGFFPAVSEEFLFRIFAVPYLRKLTRSLAIALVVAGFLWGFGHSGYPQQPFYIRGVEVGIGGVALGLILMRWGVLPALVWHYSVDAMYSALLLMRSDSLYFKLSGAAGAGIMLLPVLVALAAYWRRGGFEPEAGARNADERVEGAALEEAPVEAPPTERPVISGERWTTGKRAVALAVFALGIAALLLRAPGLGDSPKFKLTQEQAKTAADALLRERKADPASFRPVVYPDSRWQGDDGLAGKYFLERRSVADTAALFEANRPLRVWAVRYFRALDKEEFLVGVHPESGAVIGFIHTLPEDRPGADIAPEAARALAAAYARARGYDVDAMDLKETTAEKRKSRRDHALVWEARSGDRRNVDEARFRVRVDVAGDEIAGLRVFWKIPEAFTRLRSQQNAVSIAAMVLKIGVFAGAVVFALVSLARAVRRGAVAWRAVLGLAIPVTLLSGAGAALGYPLAWRAYNTAVPFETFQAMLITGMAITLGFSFMMMTALAAFIQVTQPDALPSLRARSRATLGMDAAVAALCAIGLGALAGLLRDALMTRFHALALFGVGAPDVIATAAPAFSAIASAASTALAGCAALALGAHVLGMLSRKWMAAAVLLAAAAAMIPGSARTAGEFALGYLLSLAPLAALLLFTFLFARRNLLAYALAAWAYGLRGALAELLGQASVGLQLQGWIVVAALAATLVWAAAARAPRPEGR
jgi:membrane protease YdiL (CAAX protease family)